MQKLLVQLTVYESEVLCVIQLFIPKNKNNVTSLIEFQLFQVFITNHDALMYTFEIFSSMH